MKIDFQSQTPIFLQVSQGLEDEILSGIYGEEEQIPSITELAANYKINPATALKGINLLVDAGIVYKKRGIGMFVASGALQKLKEKRVLILEDIHQNQTKLDTIDYLLHLPRS